MRKYLKECRKTEKITLVGLFCVFFFSLKTILVSFQMMGEKRKEQFSSKIFHIFFSLHLHILKHSDFQSWLFLIAFTGFQFLTLLLDLV